MFYCSLILATDFPVVGEIKNDQVKLEKIEIFANFELDNLDHEFWLM